MGSVVENFREPMYAVRETAVKSGEPLLERMGHTLGKIMGGHFGESCKKLECLSLASLSSLVWCLGTNTLAYYGNRKLV